MGSKYGKQLMVMSQIPPNGSIHFENHSFGGIFYNTIHMDSKLAFSAKWHKVAAKIMHFAEFSPVENYDQMYYCVGLP